MQGQTVAWFVRPMSGHRLWAVAALLLALAFAVRVSATSAFVGLDSRPSLTAQPDELDYELLAFNLSQGKGYVLADGMPTAARPPGTSIALLPVYLVFGRSFAAGRLWFCLLSAVTCVLVGWLANDMFGSVAGVVSALWLAFYPGHFYYPIHFVSEVPYALWTVLACGWALRAIRADSAVSVFDVLAGVAWALATLTRPQMLLGVPIAALLVVLFKGPRHRLILHCGIQIGVLVLVLSPWVARNWLVLGKPTISTVGGLTFWGAHNDRVLESSVLAGSWVRTSDLVDEHHPLEGSEVEREAAAWSYGTDFVRRNSGRMPVFWLHKMWRLLSPFEPTPNVLLYWAFAFGWIITAPFTLVGIALAWRRNRDNAMLLLLPVLATVATATVFYGSIRFRDAIAPVLIVFAGGSLASLSQVRRNRAGH